MTWLERLAKMPKLSLHLDVPTPQNTGEITDAIALFSVDPASGRQKFIGVGARGQLTYLIRAAESDRLLCALYDQLGEMFAAHRAGSEDGAQRVREVLEGLKSVRAHLDETARILGLPRVFQGAVH